MKKKPHEPKTADDRIALDQEVIADLEVGRDADDIGGQSGAGGTKNRGVAGVVGGPVEMC